VTVTAEWADDSWLRLKVAIADGYHINAHDAGEGLIPTRVTIVGDMAKLVEGIDYPIGELCLYEFADGAIPIYDATIEILVRFKEPPRGRVVTMYIDYQPCREDACLVAVKKQLVIR